MTFNENQTIPPIFDTADKVRVLVAGHEPMDTAIKRVVAADGLTHLMRNGSAPDIFQTIHNTITATRYAAALQIMGVVHGIETGDPTVVQHIDIEGFDLDTAKKLAEWIAGPAYDELKTTLAAVLTED